MVFYQIVLAKPQLLFLNSKFPSVSGCEREISGKFLWYSKAPIPVNKTETGHLSRPSGLSSVCRCGGGPLHQALSLM